MDILDIDEALKDDSFIFLEDKTHDDISNILQQWKCNNYLPPPSSNATQTQQLHQQQQEQVYKLDSRTFTRPKRKLAQNLDPQFTNTSNASQYHLHHQQQQNSIPTQNENPMFNLEIGGLVTNMQKSFLHDTSPPSFSSMDTSIDRMNNSLITSADFSNINFLQSTNSLDFSGTDINGHGGEFNLMGKMTNDGYTLSDMIRDRKALESLTMSSEGTIIKDSHIGQIDDISLTLSKTASGCSTMDNSTESVEVNHRIEGINRECKFNGGDQALNRTMVLTDEMIGEITCNLVENSMYSSIASERHAINSTHSLAHSQQSSSDTVSSQLVSALDETVCVSTNVAAVVNNENTGGNSTFDCHQNITPNNRCETPEGVENPATVKYYESTPQATSVRYNKQHYTPTLKMIDDVNISPIVASTGHLPHNATRVLSDTFENVPRINKTNNVINTKTFSGNLPMNATVEMIENIENPNETFEKQYRLYEQPSPASIEMKNVMDLAQAEANLLASNNNEEEFDHMLDEFSKVELNAEQLKIKKSLDTIKRRFYGPSKEKTQHREISREAKDMREMLRVSADLLGEEDISSSKDYMNMTMDLSGGKTDVKVSKEHLAESSHIPHDAVEVVRSPLKESVTSSSSISESKNSNGLSMSSVSNSSNGGERLLSRRSRLYDDFNLSTFSSTSSHGTKISLGSSYTVHKDEENAEDTRPNITNETENTCGQNVLEMVQEKTESTADEEKDVADPTTNNTLETPAAAQYRLSEKRERDRDRFKTIKINKNRSAGGNGQSGVLELNVPCIDDFGVDANADVLEEDAHQQNQRFSRRDKTVSPVFNNNKSEEEMDMDTNKTTSKINPNYLTYKKTKDKLTNVRNLPEIAPASANTIAVAPDATSSAKPRSLSRPRYLSGLTKFSAVSKATSADELEKSVPRQSNLTAPISGLNSGISKGSSAVNVSQNRTQISRQTGQDTGGELKSPMGIKSKSFHNLSSQHASTSNSNIGSVGGAPVSRMLGLRKPSATSTEKLAKTNPNRYSAVINPCNVQQQPMMQQKPEEGVFKVPKLVSGIRAPGAAAGGVAGKRAGLVRPSSGYYSLSVTAKGIQPVSADTECDTGRHSPTDSMSSASSRGSAQSLNKAVGIKTPNVTNATTTKVNSNTTASLTKITIGSTGIPKPSGLRPPNSLKRSGLPRPSSFIKNDK